MTTHAEELEDFEKKEKENHKKACEAKGRKCDSTCEITGCENYIEKKGGE